MTLFFETYLTSTYHPLSLFPLLPPSWDPRLADSAYIGSQVNLKIHLSLSPELWDYKHMPLCLAFYMNAEDQMYLHASTTSILPTELSLNP